MILPISIILPFSSKKNSDLIKIINAIYKQKILPKEIIIIATKKKLTFKKKKKLNKKIKIKIFYKKNINPGVARNFGIINSKNNYIAFLDHKTIPSENWLINGYKKLQVNNNEIIFGQTKYSGENFKDKIVIASTVGKNELITLPGTILKKNVFFKCGTFLEHVRSGEDGNWIKRILDHKIKSEKNEFFLNYTISKVNFKKLIIKWYTYYNSSAKLDHLKLHRQIYFLTLFTFLMIFIYNWNFIFADWNQFSKVYVHHITKKSLFYIAILYTFVRGYIYQIKKDLILVICYQ